MTDSFDGYELVEYIRRKWRFPLIVCAVALVLAAGISLLLPRKYTATARVVIEPPAGSDQRTFVAVSPIYLESLKTYEHIASGDSLFLRALERFHLRGQGDDRSVESWKKSVLKVQIPRNTKIMEISATLRDPGKAQALALYLAQETVKLSREVSRKSDEGPLREAEAQVQEARQRLERAEAAWSTNEKQQPVDDLTAHIKSIEARRDEASNNLSAAEILIAEDSERQKLAASGAIPRSELDGIRTELGLTTARATMLRERVAAQDRESARLHALVAQRVAHREDLLTERKAAEVAVAAAEAHLRDVRSAAGYTGERLNVIDPGIVPERPSSPNLPLNMLAALLLGLIVSLAYVSLEFGLGRHTREVKSFRVVRNG